MIEKGQLSQNDAEFKQKLIMFMQFRKTEELGRQIKLKSSSFVNLEELVKSKMAEGRSPRGKINSFGRQ